jgi:hypothetical protein
MRAGWDVITTDGSGGQQIKEGDEGRSTHSHMLIDTMMSNKKTLHAD